MNPYPAFLHRLSPLTENAINDLEIVLLEQQFAKGSVINARGKICRHLHFLESGLTKLFFFKEEKEFIMRFFAENSVCAPLDSFLRQTPSEYTLQALEPCRIFSLPYSEMERLCAKHHCIETAVRSITSMATVNMMNRISEMLEDNGTERYERFLKENGHLMQRISLGDLAAYIGITQVSLSRIRAKR